MKIQDYKKTPNVQFDGKVPIKYLYSQFRPCLARWFAFTGCRDARSEEQPLLEHGPAVLHKGTV